MCGRVAQITDPEKIRRLFGAAGVPPNAPPRYNGAPTDRLLVIRRNPETGRRQLDPLRWGLVPPWAKDIRIGARCINARAETVESAPAFRDAFRRRRCVVPVDAFYEWRKAPGGKQPYAVAPSGGEPMALAGLWERWRDAASGEVLRSFAVVTVPANAVIAPLHDRMPAILAPEDIPAWLGEAEASPEALKALLRPAEPWRIAIWPVSRRVNSVRNDEADLLDRAPDPYP